MFSAASSIAASSTARHPRLRRREFRSSSSSSRASADSIFNNFFDVLLNRILDRSHRILDVLFPPALRAHLLRTSGASTTGEAS